MMQIEFRQAGFELKEYVYLNDKIVLIYPKVFLVFSWMHSKFAFLVKNKQGKSRKDSDFGHQYYSRCSTYFWPNFT